jgi:hypothetical protein
VADALEFIFGRKVRRLGARKRGQRISDMVTQIQDGAVLVVDAKATGGAFDASISELRALIEYTQVQKIRQRGQNDLFAALVVSSAFAQGKVDLATASRSFIAETGVPAAFLTVPTLNEMVQVLMADVQLRTGILWRRLLAGGLVDRNEFEAEVKRVRTERCEAI